MYQIHENIPQEVRNVDNLADLYYRKYRPYVEAYSQSHNAKFRPMSSSDVVALGRKLEMFEQWHSFAINEAEGNTQVLGPIPQVGLDVITASQGLSVAPHIAGAQTINSQVGIIYFRQSKAVNSRGNVTAGQILNSSKQAPGVYPDGFASENQSEVAFPTVALTLEYNFTLTNVPIRIGTIQVSVPLSTGTLSGRDIGTADSNNNVSIAGTGFWGTVNLTTGVGTITFAADPGEAVDVTFTVGTSFEDGATIARISDTWASTNVYAEAMMLGQEMSLFQRWEMSSRFPHEFGDFKRQIAQDLTDAMTREVDTKVINRVINGVPADPAATKVWNKNPTWVASTSNPVPGVSWAEHKKELKDVIARQSVYINQVAGRGRVTTLIAGHEGCALISNLPGFIPANIDTSGPVVWGTLDNYIVILAPMITSDDIYCVYKGRGNYDVAIVNATYMPLMIETDVAHTNLARKSSYAAQWAAFDTVNPSFINKINVIDGNE